MVLASWCLRRHLCPFLSLSMPYPSVESGTGQSSPCLTRSCLPWRKGRSEEMPSLGSEETCDMWQACSQAFVTPD